mgnify:CR=1 FL=1
MQLAMHFDGKTYDHVRDSARLSGLMAKVHGLMIDGQWRTIPQICEAIGANSEASVSARLRDLRKPRFGSHTVEREYLAAGLWRYRVLD